MKLGFREILLYSCILFLLFTSKSFAALDTKTLSFYQNYIGISQANVGPRKIRVAILDNGFRDWQASSILPKDTVFIAPVVENADNDDHGTKMAEIVSQVLNARGVSYELILAPTFGYSNLVNAVANVMDADVVLYAQVWEYGGKGDGQGFINKAIEPALNNGVIWINATGNFALSSFQSAIRVIGDSWVHLPGPGHTVRVRCESKDGCDFRAVLSWNDFKNDVNLGTDKDLDFVLMDDTQQIVQTAGLKQTAESTENPGFSKYPREILQSKLKRGLYSLKVKARSSNWTNQDRLRITVSGSAIQLLDKTLDDTILAPADNSGVIAVGALDTRTSGTSSTKPDVWAPSIMAEGDKMVAGSSIASALIAAAAGVLRSNEAYTKDQILKHLKPKQRPARPAGCLQLTTLNMMPERLSRVAREGSWLVRGFNGTKLLLPEDPVLRLARLGLHSASRGDRIWWSGNSFFTQRPGTAEPVNSIEIAQASNGQAICGGNQITDSRSSIQL